MILNLFQTEMLRINSDVGIVAVNAEAEECVTVIQWALTPRVGTAALSTLPFLVPIFVGMTGVLRLGCINPLRLLSCPWVRLPAFCSAALRKKREGQLRPSAPASPASLLRSLASPYASRRGREYLPLWIPAFAGMTVGAIAGITGRTPLYSPSERGSGL